MRGLGTGAGDGGWGRGLGTGAGDGGWGRGLGTGAGVDYVTDNRIKL